MKTCINGCVHFLICHFTISSSAEIDCASFLVGWLLMRKDISLPLNYGLNPFTDSTFDWCMANEENGEHVNCCPYFQATVFTFLVVHN